MVRLIAQRRKTERDGETRDRMKPHTHSLASSSALSRCRSKTFSFSREMSFCSLRALSSRSICLESRTARSFSFRLSLVCCCRFGGCQRDKGALLLSSNHLQSPPILTTCAKMRKFPMRAGNRFAEGGVRGSRFSIALASSTGSRRERGSGR